MWSKSDLKWLVISYPALKLKPGGALEGPLVFRMLFLDGNRYVNPSAELLAEGGGTYISGYYHVKIERKDKKLFPVVFETSGKIDAVVAEKDLKPVDLHLFPKDRSLCLASPMVVHPAAAEGLSLQRYFEDFLIPYFFAQRYFAKWNKWPWGDLSHDSLGHLEWLGRINHPSRQDAHLTLKGVHLTEKDEHFERLFSTRPRMHKPCICESGKKFKGCHPDVKQAITEIRKLIYSRKIDLADYE